MKQDELNVLTAELLRNIFGSITDRGGRLDEVHLCIRGVDTHTGEPIHIRISSETNDVT